MTGADGAGEQPASVVSEVPAAGLQGEGVASTGGAAQAVGLGGSATVGTAGGGLTVTTAPLTPTMSTTAPAGHSATQFSVFSSVTGPLGGADHSTTRPFRRSFLFGMALNVGPSGVLVGHSYCHSSGSTVCPLGGFVHRSVLSKGGYCGGPFRGLATVITH